MKHSNERNLSIQILRAILVFFVIVIHTIYIGNNHLENYILISIRQLCNIAVPTFLLISGYYTNTDKINDKKYLFTKLKRIIIPLLFWNLIYFCINGASIKSMLLFKTEIHLYYIVVLAQLILFSPIIYKYINKHILYIITPLFLIIYRIFYFKYNISIPLHNYFIFGWLTYYIIGMKLKNMQLNYSHKNLILFILSFTIEIIYQSIIYKYFNFNAALSQMNIINMIVSILFFRCIAPLFNNNVKVKKNILINIGDESFGIYLMHLLILHPIVSICKNLFYNTILIVIISATSTLIICFLVIYIFKKIFPKSINKLIGF